MKNSHLWIIAFLLTLLLAYYQRVTGPTYPVKNSVLFNNQLVEYNFKRSHGGPGDHKVEIIINDTTIAAELCWKRYKTNDEFKHIKMSRNSDTLTASLPHQPPAGKLEYYIQIHNGNVVQNFPKKNSVVIRFKGNVPLWILVPHIFFMFGTMLLSTRTGLEIFAKNKKLFKLTGFTILFLLIGGFILGPITQKFAFGEYWTGIPFGTDLTDNKTLIALLGWLLAVIMFRRSKRPEVWASFAAIILIGVFLIPHSVMGSELDYNKMDKVKTENSLQK